MTSNPYDAILLVSFGGPEGPDDVIPFLENVTAGRNIPRERLAVVGEQYAAFGGVSPLNEQCRRQRCALETALRDGGPTLPVYWGNRNWQPYLDEVIESMAEDGVSRALAVFTSAYSSYSGCRQYRENIAEARDRVEQRRPELNVPTIDKVRAYYDHPGFIEPFVAATQSALQALREQNASAGEGDRATGSKPTLVFTAHSIPTSMASSCDYEAQLREAARLVTERLDDGQLDWTLAWQSRSGPPQVPWLEPDINDVLPRLAEEGVRQVVIVPLGFVSDHMEVMWDLDTQAAATAEAVGITMTRAEAPGTGPASAFIEMWVDLIRERIEAERAASSDSSTPVNRRALGSLPVRPDICAEGCCPAPVRPDLHAGRETSR